MGEAELEIHPLTRDRWDDLATLFDRPGDPKGCWCMFYRVRGREFERLWGTGARAAFREVVDDGPPPGLLAYRDGAPVGWCAVAPREAFPGSSTPHHQAAHGRPPPAGRSSASTSCGASAAAGSRPPCWRRPWPSPPSRARPRSRATPRTPRATRKHANEMFVGSMSMFAEAGFTEAGRRSPTRPIMRRGVGVRGLKASPPVNGVSGRGGPGGRGGSR